jgi:hypothetical protein
MDFIFEDFDLEILWGHQGAWELSEVKENGHFLFLGFGKTYI